MSYHTDPERKRIIAQALAARTLADIEQVTLDLRQWVHDHPQDFGIRDTFELLSHRSDLLTDEAELQSPASARA